MSDIWNLFLESAYVGFDHLIIAIGYMSGLLGAFWAAYILLIIIGLVMKPIKNKLTGFWVSLALRQAVRWAKKNIADAP